MPKKTDKEPQNWKRIWQMIRPYRGWMIASMVLAAFTVAFTLYIPILVGDAIDAMVEAGKVSFAIITPILWKIAILAVLTALFQWIMQTMHNKITYQVVRDFRMAAFEKIQKEAPYHALTNAGHISYIEMDGDPTENLDAFERVIRCMKEKGIGYGSVNHPVDRDPVCGFSGIIGDQCPGCGRHEDDGVPFERIRRITGYLVGTLDRFNNAKRAEEHDRVKHHV